MKLSEGEILTHDAKSNFKIDDNKFICLNNEITKAFNNCEFESIKQDNFQNNDDPSFRFEESFVDKFKIFHICLQYTMKK